MFGKKKLVCFLMTGLPLFGCGSDSQIPPEPTIADEATELRIFIDAQVLGGIDNLMVPEENSDIPQPMLDDGSPDPIFQTTEAKRYLGKQLFHDPVRTVRTGPLGGVDDDTRQTGSCGSCHFGEVSSKAGTQINFSVGGEGRGYTDAEGNFIPRRRARLDILPQVRNERLFAGDQLVDELPTLTDIFENAMGERTIGLPTLEFKLPYPGPQIASGRFDAVDSVSRNAPSVLGAAFNNRLLWGGLAGESNDSFRGLNPFDHPAQENLALLLLDAHRMLGGQSAVLQQIPVYVELFRDAFPEEAALADDTGNLDDLINDVTVLRATATFMRTAVTRNTPWDKFLAGDNDALTPSQLRGARLFFSTPETDGEGAACWRCHSGPMLNKQSSDPDVAGVGEFIEENFQNLGLDDHPLQALNREVRNDPFFRDDGRREITGLEEDAFKFRVMTLRQLKGSKTFFHNGSFTSVREVVEYFNNGVPQDEEVAGAAATLSSRFTYPRGEGSERGLGLSQEQMDDLTDFLENALHDPAFVTYDPDSSTDTFQLNEEDLNYSKNRPDLAQLGAVDGRVASGLPQDNNDPLSRRDMGLEFLEVTADMVRDELVDSNITGDQQIDNHQFTNITTSVVDTHLIISLVGLPNNIQLENASGTTINGDPYVRVFLDDGVLPSGQSITREFVLRDTQGKPLSGDISYTFTLKSGQGDPASDIWNNLL